MIAAGVFGSSRVLSSREPPEPKKEDVRYRRLTLEAGDASVSLPFHERLTVVAGVGRLERETLVSELLGALAGDRDGVHLEVEDDDGRVLEVSRTHGEPAVVRDLESAEDVSNEFIGPAGHVDVLASWHLDPKSARRLTRL